MTSIVVERASLPPAVVEWLEASEQKKGVVLYREEDDRTSTEWIRAHLKTL
jgi:hypothetical protein